MTKFKRAKIKDFDYEVDERGHVFSKNYNPGYGNDFQLKPTRPRNTLHPLYTLRRDGEVHVFRVDELVKKHFTPVVDFYSSKWFWATRKAAEEHNTELRADFLERRAEAKAAGQKLEPTQKPEPPKIKPKEDHTSARLGVWTNPEELILDEAAIEKYSTALGGDSRDASMCPLR